MKYTFFSLLILLVCSEPRAQVVINEASNRSIPAIWGDRRNLRLVRNIQYGFFCYKPAWMVDCDNKAIPRKWVCLIILCKGASMLAIFASGLDIKEAVLVNHWELSHPARQHLRLPEF
ncbi:MAG: hypothetical protein U0T82_11415 [Bacteroidales bacterium]